MDAVIDTSVIIEIFRGNKDTLYQICDYNCKITSITVFELHCGDLKENEMIMIDNLPKLNFDNKSAKIAGSIFKKTKKRRKNSTSKGFINSLNMHIKQRAFINLR